MTVRARSAALVPLFSFFVWAPPPALSQEQPVEPTLQLAQRQTDDDKGKKGNPERARKDDKRDGARNNADRGNRDQGQRREGRPNREEGQRKDAGRPNREGGQRKDAGRPNRDERQRGDADRKGERPRPEREQARPGPTPQQQKQDAAAKARAAQQKQEAEAAKKKAQQDRQNAEREKQRAQAKKKEEDAAKQRAQQQRKQQQSEPERVQRREAFPKRDDRSGPREARPGSKDERPGARPDRRQGDRDPVRRRDTTRDARPDRKAANPADVQRRRDEAARRFDNVRKQRTERRQGQRNVIVEPDKRVIVRQKNNRTIIRHDDNRRFRHSGREMRRERQKDGTWLIVTAGLAGALIYSLQDDDGRLLRRSRRYDDGREMVLIDNRRHYYSGRGPSRTYDPYDDPYVSLPPPRVSIPRDQYIVEYDRASVDDIYDALMAPPVETLDRKYSLDEVRYSYSLLERMRRVDLDAVNFDFGSWEVTEDQYDKLERVADAMHRILEESPDEVFLLEGHTDAVGSDVDNLSLSDRRAESVAIALTDEFEIPPENLMTQGYGEYHLKVNTQEASRINRRVAVRRITPLLDREGWSDDVSGR